MRLVFRLLGTWMIGIALVFLVVDGTKSLAANALVFTGFGQAWSQLHSPSLDAVSGFFESRFFADLLHVLLQNVLTYPAFTVFAVPGVMLALAGRRPRRERFLRQEQI
jgi:fluoride ion exporter CrcB/FEX